MATKLGMRIHPAVMDHMRRIGWITDPPERDPQAFHEFWRTAKRRELLARLARN